MGLPPRTDPTRRPTRRTAPTRVAGAGKPVPGGGRAAGLSLLRWLGRLTVLASIAGGLYALGYGGWRFLTSSPRFDVAEVDVDGGAPLRHADAEELVRRTAVLGKNIFSVDLDAVRRDLEADPWVRKAEVERDLPARLRVRIREEHPAVLVAMGALYLSDDQGRLFKRLGAGDPTDFPVVSGISREEYEGTPLAATARIREGIAAVHAFASSPAAARARLEEVVVDPAIGVTLVLTAGRALSVRLGRGAHAEKLARLVRVLDALAARHATAGLILLDDPYQPDRITVRVIDRAAEDS